MLRSDTVWFLVWYFFTLDLMTGTSQSRNVTKSGQDPSNNSKQSQNITSFTKLTNKTRDLVAENRIRHHHAHEKIMINVVNPAHEKTNEDKHMKAVHEINNITEKPDSGNVHDDIIDLKHLYILVPKEPKSNNKETNDNKFNNTLNEVTFNANEEIEDVDIIADVKHTRQIHAPVEDNKTVDLFDKTNRNGTDDNMENYRNLMCKPVWTYPPKSQDIASKEGYFRVEYPPTILTDELDDYGSNIDTFNLEYYWSDGEGSFDYNKDSYWEQQEEELLNQESPYMKCCQAHGVAEHCLGLCDSDDMMFGQCNMLCVYLYEHIAKACICNPDDPEVGRNIHVHNMNKVCHHSGNVEGSTHCD